MQTRSTHQSPSQAQWNHAVIFVARKWGKKKKTKTTHTVVDTKVLKSFFQINHFQSKTDLLLEE